MSNSASHGLDPNERKNLEDLIAGLEGAAPAQPQQPAPQQPAPQPVAQPQQPAPQQPYAPAQPMPPAEPLVPPAPEAQPEPQPFAPAPEQPAPPAEPSAQPQPAPAPQGEPQPYAQPAAEPQPEPFAQPMPPAEPVAPQPAQPEPQPFAPAPEQPVPPAPRPEPFAQPAQPAPVPQPEPQPFAQPAPEQPVSQPEPQPFTPAPEQTAPQPQPEAQPAPIITPQPAPQAEEEEYVPAYAHLDEPDAPAQPAGQGGDPLARFEAEDILLSIAIRDAEGASQHKAGEALQTVMKEASLAEEPRKRKKSTIKLSSLPFDQIVPGTPVVATFYSPSGGVGKTSQAMNTGALIAAVAQRMAEKKMKEGHENVRIPRVLLLDGDLVHGSLDVRLKGKTGPSIHTLLLYLDEREDAGFSGENAWPRVYENAPAGEKAMRDFVIWHDQLPNLNVLAAPDQPDKFYDFGPAEYRNLLRLLGQFYDVIIIDAGTDIVLESQRAWLSHANQVFLITSPDIDRLYNSAKAARYMAKAQRHPADPSPNPQILPPLITRERLSVVTTRADADAGFEIGDVLNELFPWLDKHQDFRIPDFSAEMLKANNRGRFLVLENPEYAKVISKMAQMIFARYLAASQQRALPEADPRQQPGA